MAKKGGGCGCGLKHQRPGGGTLAVGMKHCAFAILIEQRQWKRAHRPHTIAHQRLWVLLSMYKSTPKQNPACIYDLFRYNPFILREWWTHEQTPGKRYTYWQNYRMRKDVRRRKAVEDWGEMRLRLKMVKDARVLPQAVRVRK